MYSLLKNVTIPSQITSEALQLARLAKLVRAEYFRLKKLLNLPTSFHQIARQTVYHIV